MIIIITKIFDKAKNPILNCSLFYYLNPYHKIRFILFLILNGISYS